MARFRVSYQLLKKALYLPDDTEIRAIDGRWFRYPETFEVYVAHDSFPAPQEGMPVIEVNPWFERLYEKEDYDPAVVFKGWDYEAPECSPDTP